MAGRYRAALSGLLLLAASAGLTTACGADSSGDSSGKPQTLRVETTSNSVNYASVWVAEGAGLFKKHGVEVDITNVAAAATGPASLVAGRSDLFATSPSGAIAAIVHGQPLKMVYPLSNISWASQSVVGRKGITRFEQLSAMGTKCKMAGMAPGSWTYALQQTVIKRYRLQCQTIQVTDQANILKLVISGQADWGVSFPNASSAPAAAGDVTLLFDPTTATESEGVAFFPTDALATGLFTTDAVIKDKGAALDKFVAALDDAYDLIQKSKPEELAAYALKVTKAFGAESTPQSLAEQFRLIKSALLDGTITEQHWKDSLRVAHDLVKTPGVEPDSPDQAFDKVVQLAPFA